MLLFFLLNIVGGAFGIIKSKIDGDDPSIWDILGLVYSIVILIAAIVWWFNYHEDPISKYS